MYDWAIMLPTVAKPPVLLTLGHLVGSRACLECATGSFHHVRYHNSRD